MALQDSLGGNLASTAPPPAQGHVISPVCALGNAPIFRVSEPQSEGVASDAPPALEGHVISPFCALVGNPSFSVSDPQSEGNAGDTPGTQVS